MESFLTAIKEIDENQQAFLPKNLVKDFVVTKAVCEEWTKMIRSQVKTHHSLIEKNIEELRSLTQNQYPDTYIFPYFSAYIQTLKYKNFPFHVEKDDFERFINKIKKSKKATAIESCIAELKSKYKDEDGLYSFVDHNFRPRHPIYYSLKSKEKSLENTLDIDAKSIIEKLMPFVDLPQLYNRHDYLLALQVSSGLKLDELLGMTNEEPVGDFKIQYSMDNETIRRHTLCPSRTFIRGITFLKSQKISRSNALKASADVAETVLGIKDFSYRTIPALYSSLVKHFFPSEINEPKSDTVPWITPDYNADARSIFTYRIIGQRSIDLILSEWQTHKNLILDEIVNTKEEKTKDRLSKSIQAIAENPTLKVNVLTLKKTLKCSSEDASAVRTALDEYANGVRHEH